MEKGGGIRALGAEIAEDAASTKLVRRQGLSVNLVNSPFEQPLGCRGFRDVWLRGDKIKMAGLGRSHDLRRSAGAGHQG